MLPARAEHFPGFSRAKDFIKFYNSKRLAIRKDTVKEETHHVSSLDNFFTRFVYERSLGGVGLLSLADLVTPNNSPKG